VVAQYIACGEFCELFFEIGHCATLAQAESGFETIEPGFLEKNRFYLQNPQPAFVMSGVI
jgi:hypothetical protein